VTRDRIALIVLGLLYTGLLLAGESMTADDDTTTDVMPGVDR